MRGGYTLAAAGVGAAQGRRGAMQGTMAMSTAESFKGSWEPTTFAGLCAILDNSKVPVSMACQAVEECIASNR